jgi:uncharacterized protein DUF6931
MSCVRFATANALFETYPEVAQKIAAAPTDQPAIDFARSLLSKGGLPDAVTFCAYLLPRREAVWWACSSVRTLTADLVQSKAEGLLAAEAWVIEPDDRHRQAALAIGTAGDRSEPSTWLARAAGWSGGFQTSGAKQVPIPPYMTARAARIAVLFSAAKVRGAQRASGLQSCIENGIKLAETGFG